MKKEEPILADHPKIDSAVLTKLLYEMYWDYPIVVCNKMNFLNMYCDADFVAVGRSGAVYEFEIKISRPDFHRDKTKLRHEIYSMEKPGNLPNRFWYVTAPGIITAEDLPSWAGWMEFDSGELRVRRQAPKMTHQKHSIQVVMRLARAMRSRGSAALAA